MVGVSVDDGKEASRQLEAVAAVDAGDRQHGFDHRCAVVGVGAIGANDDPLVVQPGYRADLATLARIELDQRLEALARGKPIRGPHQRRYKAPNTPRSSKPPSPLPMSAPILKPKRGVGKRT